MRAEIVSVGTELLMGQISDTNAQHLGGLLPELGIEHTHRQTVGDNLERLTEALKLAVSRADIVFTIGGLGPTEDDMTRDGIAAALGVELIRDEKIAERIRKLFAYRKIPWTESQVRQAMRPANSTVVENPNGSAVGLIVEQGDKVVIAMPGPRGEFVPMAEGPVREYLQKKAHGSEVIHSRLLRVCDMGESSVEEAIRPLLASTNPTVAPYAKLGEVHLRITAKAPNIDLAEQMIAPVEARVRAALGDCVFGADDQELESAVLDMLKGAGACVAVAESLTGGALGSRFTSVAGAGDSFIGGVISYQKSVKAEILKVDRSILNDPQRGPVDAEVSEQMAAGVRDLMNTTYGIGITGNAGPTTDDGNKPVGLVFVGIAGPAGVQHERYQFQGTRDSIRRRSTQVALAFLRRVLLQSKA